MQSLSNEYNNSEFVMLKLEINWNENIRKEIRETH